MAIRKAKKDSVLKQNASENALRVDVATLDHDVASYDERAAFALIQTIARVLKSRFRDFSPTAPSLNAVSSILDMETLDKIFTQSWSAPTFDAFCQAVDSICADYETRLAVASDKKYPKIALAQAFNNFAVMILGRRGKISSRFLEKYVREISPELADELDFDAFTPEPTVFVLGNNAARLCDLLFAIPFKDESRGSFPLIVLMEHKSTPDRYVVRQMLFCLVAALDHITRNADKFKMPDGRLPWPFLLLFYTGARPWGRVLNLSDLFGTSKPNLDRLWIFRLKFKFVSLFSRAFKRSNRRPYKKSDPNWLKFFMEFLRRAEATMDNKDADSKTWLQDWGETLTLIRDEFDPNCAEDDELLRDFMWFSNVICMKKGFERPTGDQVVDLIQRYGGEKMYASVPTMFDIVREEGEELGRKEGLLEGEMRSREQTIRFALSTRFPQATLGVVDDVLGTIKNEDSYNNTLTTIFTAKSLNELQTQLGVGN